MTASVMSSSRGSGLRPDISGITISHLKDGTLPISQQQLHHEHNVPPLSSSSAPSRRNALWWRRWINADQRQHMLGDLLATVYWKVILVICSVILLFGARIRELWLLPQAADTAFDLVFILVLAILLVDIILRCDSDADYFVCFRCGKWRLGSFLFWYDLTSALTLLHDISFIAKYHFDEKHIHVFLSSTGNDFTGLNSVTQQKSPVEFDGSMVVLVFQTFRVARFIRSSRALKASSKIDWYSIMNFCTPSCWKKKKHLYDGRPSDLLLGRRWSVLGISMLAVAKASSNKAKLNVPWWKRIFRRSTFDTEEFRRNFAATRIQRAWRAVHRAIPTPADYTSVELDVAWKAPVSSIIRRNRSVKSTIPHASPHRPAIHAMNNLATNRQAEALEKRRNESQVGSKMRELTGQRVAFGIILAILFSVFFTYVERDVTRPLTMIILHRQTSNPLFAEKALTAARSTSIPDLILYSFPNGTVQNFTLTNEISNLDKLREWDKLRITVEDGTQTTFALFSQRNERRDEAIVSLLATLFILIVWFFGVGSFAGPVMVLVVVPIERMVRLLGMLMLDPLGYQSTSRFKRFQDEEHELTKNTRWTKEILQGMETSFLMSTILRIGNLMKVGFGSAGVEIIRNNLEPGQNKNTLILSSQGSTVSCIFLFCDIRNFTDATECLQEEVFVFTNSIAAVVHSFCHAYGGSANKNVGDAFLISWQLEEDLSSTSSGMAVSDGHDSFSWSQHQGSFGKSDGFIAKNNQADKALLSVVKICMALYHDDHFIEPLTKGARDALVNKLKQRPGPVVQMGFGMHAGRAVQGAIGSQRKIDPTYVSEAVERAEFLESSTKKYGVKLLMSESFHRLLHPANRRRCRKIDQIKIKEEEEGDDDDLSLNGEIMELFTFDMDIEALSVKRDVINRDQSDTASDGELKRDKPSKRGGKRLSLRLGGMSSRPDGSDELDASGFLNTQTLSMEEPDGRPRKLVVPTGPALYNANVWTSEDMRTIRQLYSDGLFFQKFMSGLQSFYAKDWEHSKNCFAVILERFEDGPSRYFMNQIEHHNGKPPRDFQGYGTA